jgi:hypothetical protein
VVALQWGLFLRDWLLKQFHERLLLYELQLALEVMAAHGV